MVTIFFLVDRLPTRSAVALETITSLAQQVTINFMGTVGADKIFGLQPTTGASTAFPYNPPRPSNFPSTNFAPERFEYALAKPYLDVSEPVSPDQGLYGALPNEILSSLRPVGDFNLDGSPDFIATGATRSFWIFGPMSQIKFENVQDVADVIIDHAALGTPSNDFGDFNADGAADLVFSKPVGNDYSFTVVMGGKTGKTATPWPREWNQSFVDTFLSTTGTDRNARKIALPRSLFSPLGVFQFSFRI